MSTSKQQQQLSEWQDLTTIPQVKGGGREEEDIGEGGRLFNVAVRGGKRFANFDRFQQVVYYIAKCTVHY